MKRELLHRRLHTIFAALALLAPAAPLAAEVLSTSARVEVEVQELIGGQPASFIDDADEFPATENPPDLNAFARLTSTDLSGNLEAMGQSFSDFFAPVSLMGNPGELAIEAACYSNSGTASYAVRATCEESRSVFFTASDANFNNSGTAEVSSLFFLTGAIILWAVDPSGLDSVEGAIRISVEDADAGATLFSSSVAIRAAQAGEAELSTVGPVTARPLSLAELADLGVDAASMAVLEDVAERGQLIMVLIPSQSHLYDYQVLEGEPLTLHARLQLDLTNSTGQTGVAATVGRPFSNLAGFIHSALPQVNGEVLQTAVNKGMAQSVNGDPQPVDPAVNLACGALGAEAFLPFLFFASLCRWGIPSRRRR